MRGTTPPSLQFPTDQNPRKIQEPRAGSLSPEAECAPGGRAQPAGQSRNEAVLGVLGRHAEVGPHPRLCNKGPGRGREDLPAAGHPLHAPGVLISNMQDPKCCRGMGDQAGRCMAAGWAGPGLLCCWWKLNKGEEESSGPEGPRRVKAQAGRLTPSLQRHWCPRQTPAAWPSAPTVVTVSPRTPPFPSGQDRLAGAHPTSSSLGWEWGQ